MKELLYAVGLEGIKNSGLGKAINHQLEALKDSNIEYTLDSTCKDYDVATLLLNLMGATYDNMNFSNKENQILQKQKIQKYIANSYDKGMLKSGKLLDFKL